MARVLPAPMAAAHRPDRCPRCSTGVLLPCALDRNDERYCLMCGHVEYPGFEPAFMASETDLERNRRYQRDYYYRHKNDERSA